MTYAWPPEDVMAGLVPAIHVSSSADVDARHKGA
jgi:hypothetical protein